LGRRKSSFGLIFLKYISDAFEAKHAVLEAQKAQRADPEDPDEYASGELSIS
jgi:type I restriction enzyme M protein